MFGRNRAETDVQNNGRGAQIYYRNFDHFAQLFMKSHRLKDRGTEVNKAKSISGIRHSLQIGKKLASGHP